eukprot:gb/GFBE01039882.1/.p1 GENE.gb/GFBE01039882.1/~~gb/GFBE01039882.1/.p1  ORF type:complete len:109 (+),score=22.79 gb/GFBE01039882.1/:1-327(+)
MGNAAGTQEVETQPPTAQTPASEPVKAMDQVDTTTLSDLQGGSQMSAMAHVDSWRSIRSDSLKVVQLESCKSGSAGDGLCCLAMDKHVGGQPVQKRAVTGLAVGAMLY